MRVPRVHARGVGQAHLREELERLPPRVRARQTRVGAQHLGHLLPGRDRRVQRRVRVLEHHRDARSAHALERRRREGQEIVALEVDRAPRHAAVGVERAHDGERERRFAGAALPDERDGLAGGDAQARATHGVHHTRGRRVRDREVAQLEDGRVTHRRSSAPSATRGARRRGD